MNYSFPRYLEAKATVDDRALNGRLWDRLWQELPTSVESDPLKILDVGAGTGTMITRILNSNRLNRAAYTAVDADQQNIDVLNAKRQRWGSTHPNFIIRAEAKTIEAYVTQATKDTRFDLIIAHALLDLVDLPRTLTQLFSLLKPNGLFYFTINFDGGTIFEPATSFGRAFDQRMIELYHSTMDNPYSGRQLIHHVQQAGGVPLAAGSSDWVVFAQNGRYPADEQYFLHYILHFFDRFLKDHPALNQPQLPQWLAERREQIEQGQLVYIAHQLDIIGRLASIA